MSDELYSVDKYTDEQLYHILDIDNPTDRELEARILSLIRKYKNIQNETGDRLALFFENIYTRFFFDEDNPDDIQEGFESTPTPAGKLIQQDFRVAETKQDIAPVQTFEYSKDKLQINPLIKQTITRVISIDSQYRDTKTSPFSTDFTFDLSEPLRDVVSLKLYSIQIPYTWYTIGKSYGSNFFYLSSIYDDKYSYKIEIDAGTYNSNELIAEINQRFEDLSNNAASEINFNGLNLLSYDNPSSKTTVNLDIQNTFNESYYSFQFPVVEEVINSIADYMGFNNTLYYPYCIYSNQTYFRINDSDNEKKQNFVLDSSNNFFTVIQYITNASSGVVTDLNRVIITLKNSNGTTDYTGNVTRANILDAVNQAIKSSPYFEKSSGIEQIDASSGYRYYKLKLIFNRQKIKYLPNSKMKVIFPDETPKPNQYFDAINSPIEQFTIWNKSVAKYNCFYFDNSVNPYSRFLSESPYRVSDITVDFFTHMVFKCNTAGYQYVNDFSLNIPSNVYTLPELVDVINSTLIDYSQKHNNIFNINNTRAFLDNSNKFNLNLDMTKYFINKNYRVLIDADSVFQISPGASINSFTSYFDTSGNTNTSIQGNISYNAGNSGYVTDRTYLFKVVPIGSDGNQNAPHMVVPLKRYTTGYTTYPNTETFISYLNQSILDFSVNVVEINDIQYPLLGSSLTYTINNSTNRLDISLNVQCNYYLSESNFDLSFSNLSNGNLFSWSDLKINPSYHLHAQQINSVYASIVGSETVTTNSINVTNDNNTITILTDNSEVPQQTIQLVLTPQIYTITDLYVEINRLFAMNINTRGSTIVQNNGYTELFLNINNIYTTADFKLVFYNAVSFTGCFSGIKSVQNTTWDTTIGWILGFRGYDEYYLNASNLVKNSNDTSISYYLTSTDGRYMYTPVTNSYGQLVNTVVGLTGDTTLNTNLYNYFLISLDDYIQNHLNDGLVTITQNQRAIESTDSSYTSRQKCDPGTNSLYAASTKQSNADNMTLSQLYSLNQSIISNKPDPEMKKYSPGPFIKDLFGIIPMKIPAKTGDMFVEYGGTLQNQTRVYFGPVNIRKMTIQLLNDRGGLVDLNRNNWTFSFVCEQLYRSPETT